MNPYLDIQKNPHTKIIVNGNKPILIDCYIDTGFSGGIAIPVIYRNNFVSKPKSLQRFVLADGSMMPVELFKIEVKYKNIKKLISGIFTQGKDALVGVDFLKGFKLILDLRKFTISLD